LVGDIGSDLALVGNSKLTAKLRRRLETATEAYAAERYRDAENILKELLSLAPESVAIRELYGFTLYRLGRWRAASRQLQMLIDMTGTVDQHPVLADCERALGHHDRVDRLWVELRRAGASIEVLGEGRIVTAGSLADRGRIAEAITLLTGASGKLVRHPAERHLRQWYALADLYERGGDLPKARELFRRVVEADPELSDAAERLTALA
jgi:tetratricopeptide (TPR) repeat protein